MPLVDPYLKTSRAKVDLEDSRERLGGFRKEPCAFIREDDVENQLHIVRMRVRAIPDDIPLIASDLFYCLRASLDQFVLCLAKINATPGNPEDTQFPILEQRDVPKFNRQTSGVPHETDLTGDFCTRWILSHFTWHKNPRSGHIGLGDECDASKLEACRPVAVIILPGNTPRFHWAKSGEYVTQVTAMGPLGLEYLNAKDDPRNNKPLEKSERLFVNPRNQEFAPRRGVDSGVIEEAARLNESHTPIPLKHLASCHIEVSR
jgi:hypothetical protein